MSVNIGVLCILVYKCMSGREGKEIKASTFLPWLGSKDSFAFLKKFESQPPQQKPSD